MAILVDIYTNTMATEGVVCHICVCVCVCHDTYVLNYKEHEKNFHSKATLFGLVRSLCDASTLKFVFRSIHIYNIWQQCDKQNKTGGKQQASTDLTDAPNSTQIAAISCTS